MLLIRKEGLAFSDQNSGRISSMRIKVVIELPPIVSYLPPSPSPVSPENVSCTMPQASMEVNIGSLLKLLLLSFIIFGLGQ